jgi:malate dehydrogenase (oxaloacetate-decarboxylating)
MSADKSATIFDLSGDQLLSSPRYNKGTAFSTKERELFDLTGRLPARIETIEEQSARIYWQLSNKTGDLEKNLFLMQVFATNTTLFFRLLESHLEELLPIIYTPTIGEAVMQFSKNYLRPHGLIISYPEIEKIDAILAQIDPKQLDIAVVTDGEGVLGIGDQGVGGLNIAIGKLIVYTACSGINPFRTLPIQLDVGTNNEELLADPFYLGWRHKRISGDDYYHFLDQFVESFSKRFPDSFLHWEDFGKDNARKVLDRYRFKHQSFNDDIQGTGAIALAAVLSGIKQSKIDSAKHRFCIFGAGTAGTGIADQICQALSHTEKVDIAQIRKRFYLIDRNGLIHKGQPEIQDFQTCYAHDPKDLQEWRCISKDNYSLEDVVKNAGITVLIGCSTSSQAFTQPILQQMAKNSDRPIIMPLSNPTSKAEATPAQILQATSDKALIATGSPFASVDTGKRQIRISQCNNALIYPGIALGMLISKATHLTESMLFAASRAVSDSFVSEANENGLLPDFNNIKDLSGRVAKAITQQAIADKTAAQISAEEFERRLEKLVWKPEYLHFQKG